MERQDPDNFPRLQTRERCALEIAAYVFKKMSNDDELVSLFDIILQLASVTRHVGELEEDIEIFLAHNTVTDKCLILLEYKSIDQEA